MRTWYMVLRGLAYGAGLLGVVLLVLGRRALPPRPALQAAGGVLILVMFTAFLASYVLYVAARLKRR